MSVYLKEVILNWLLQFLWQIEVINSKCDWMNQFRFSEVEGHAMGGQTLFLGLHSWPLSGSCIILTDAKSLYLLQERGVCWVCCVQRSLKAVCIITEHWGSPRDTEGEIDPEIRTEYIPDEWRRAEESSSWSGNPGPPGNRKIVCHTTSCVGKETGLCLC